MIPSEAFVGLGRNQLEAFAWPDDVKLSSL
jgi:hypothetical protein